MDKNLNDTLDNSNNLDLKPDFNTAVKMSAECFSYEQLIDYLARGTDVEKQFAALELDEIRSQNDALILTSNLIRQDGKIREVVAFRINEFLKNENFVHFFQGEKFYEIFLQGIMDINGNICRIVIEFTLIPEFKIFLSNKLPNCIEEILSVIDNLSKNEKQYKISKRNFQLYWSLEALYNIIEEIDIAKIKNILEKTIDFEDYTIREKTAKILSKTVGFDELKAKLKNDSNYYVRRYLDNL